MGFDPNKGQAQAIEYLANNSADANAAWSRLTKALTNAGPVERKDPYRAERVLVATVSKGMSTIPGDRMLWSRVFVQPITFEFAGYTIASTDTRTLKIAGIESTTGSKLSVGFGLDAAVSGASKDSPAPSIDSNEKATADINADYEALGVDIRPDFLRIIRESPVGGDVVGNTAIHLWVLTDPQAIRRLPSEGPDGKNRVLDIKEMDIPSLVINEAHLTDGVTYLPPKEAKILIHPQDVLPHCPLIANVWMMYEMRQIESGRSHYLEGLQAVKLVENGERAQRVEIVRADDIAPAVWSIKVRSKEDVDDPNDRYGADITELPDLRAQTKNAMSRRIVSTDYTTLSELAHWIKAFPDTSLQDLEFKIKPGDTLIPFKHVENDCTPPKR